MPTHNRNNSGRSRMSSWAVEDNGDLSLPEALACAGEINALTVNSTVINSTIKVI